jgi:hypothetical protein
MMSKRRSIAGGKGDNTLTTYPTANTAEAPALRHDLVMGHGRMVDGSFSGENATADSNERIGDAITDAAVGEDAVPVKKRRTKNYKWREDMAKKSREGGVLTRVPALEPTTFANWDEFIRGWTEYMLQTRTLYRRRSSCSTTSWNSKNRFKTLPVPESFQYATMAYWCTHGCIQPSRGTGVRAHLHNRFTGCTARITADVVYEKTENNEIRWFIRVRNQVR